MGAFPDSPSDCLEGMDERAPGRFYLSHKGIDVPMVYGILWQN